MSWRNNYGFRPYVPVAERRRNAQRETAKLAKKGKVIRPIQIEGRAIAHTFWGKAWCENLESYMDYANRLPRGRTYVRNGSVVHLDVKPGEIEAIVSGSELYQVKVSIVSVVKSKWKALCQECAGGIGSLVELLQGRLSDRVMDVITRKGTGLFPAPAEIKLKCSCPDWANMCKHVAAVLYGVGARLDQSPELLFVLRSVNHKELITQAAAASDLTAKAGVGGPELAESELSAVFGIELDTETAPAAVPSAAKDIPTDKAKTPTAGQRTAQARGSSSTGKSAAAKTAAKPAPAAAAKRRKKGEVR